MSTVKFLKKHEERCTGCGTCMRTCSTTFFKTDDPGRSCISINPSQQGFAISVCDQRCRLCIAECPVQAITVSAQGTVLVNRKICVGCLACVAVCPIGAMKHQPPDAGPFKCIACGACARKCPENAIEIAVEEAQE